MKAQRARAFFIGLALSLTVLPAYAATLTFDWSATAAGPASSGFFPFTGSGLLTATTGAGGDLVTNITGSFTPNFAGGTPLMVTGVGPLNASPVFMTNNLIFPIGTTFTGPPVAGSGVSYTSVANLDKNGLAFETSAGVLIMASQVQPNSDPSMATGNFYSQVAPPGSTPGSTFGVGLFDLTLIPPVGNGNQGDNSQGNNNNSQGDNNNSQGNAALSANLSNADPLDPPAVPLPAALPLFATGVGGLGLLGWRRKRKAQAVD